jgi:ABC-type amino acid transport substrate-binding protein
MAVVRMIVLALLCVSGLARAAPVRVVMDANYPPFSHRTPDGKLEGYSVDLWRLWEKKTGRQAELIAVNWAQVQPTLLEGRADVIDPVFRTAARTASLDFSMPYATVGTAIYADASIGAIHDIPSLRGFEVGVQASDACAEELQRAGVTGVRIFPSYQDLVNAAANQSVKLLCMDENSADYRLYQLGLQRQYVKAFQVTRNGLRRAVKKGDQATLAMVENGMAKITRRARRAARQMDGPSPPLLPVFPAPAGRPAGAGRAGPAAGRLAGVGAQGGARADGRARTRKGAAAYAGRKQPRPDLAERPRWRLPDLQRALRSAAGQAAPGHRRPARRGALRA